ncbi:MAG: hypothetical protein MUO50_05595 [Longimicrobiales bacterium]|nr:hypothetical protein [Longimicrobiales bacterium]
MGTVLPWPVDPNLPRAYLSATRWSIPPEDTCPRQTGIDAVHYAFRITEVPGEDARIEVIQMTEKQQRFQLEVGGEPRSVALDPNSWALIRASFTKGEDS